MGQFLVLKEGEREERPRPRLNGCSLEKEKKRKVGNRDFRGDERRRGGKLRRIFLLAKKRKK